MIQSSQLLAAVCLVVLPVQLLALYIREEPRYWAQVEGPGGEGALGDRNVAPLDPWGEEAWERDAGSNPRGYLTDLAALKSPSQSKRGLVQLLTKLRHQPKTDKRTLAGAVDKKCYCADDIFCRRRRTADGFNC